jgi:hypothetical protein
MIFISLQAKKNLNSSKGTIVKAGSHLYILVEATGLAAECPSVTE